VKVLIVSDWFLKLVVEGQAMALQDAGHDVRLLCRDHALEFGGDAAERAEVIHRLRSSGIEVIELAGRRYRLDGWRTVVQARLRIRAWAPDVVSAHENADPRLLLLSRGTPIAYTVHDPQPHPGAKRLNLGERIVAALWIRSAAAVVVHGDELVDALPSRVARRNVMVVPHGIDVAARPLRVPDQPVVLLFGRLESYKGISVLIEAMDHVWQAAPGVRLRIAGHGPAALEIPPNDRIDFTHAYIPETEVTRLLEGATVMVLPYVQASQSGVGLLSIAKGIPTVVTRTGALPDLAVDPNYIVEPGRARELAMTLLKALDDDMAARVRVLEHARRQFSWDVVAGRYADVYREIIRVADR
jgi:glycosyltransferase involved in cell wall biosynthesis